MKMYKSISEIEHRHLNPLHIFLISPLLSYFLALKNIRFKESRITILLICGFFGFMMNTQEEGFDLYRYLRMLEQSQSIKDVINGFINGKETDLYAPLSIAIIRLFTKNGHILMLWFGLVFGYLYSKGLEKFGNSDSIISYLLIFVFANIFGISSLAGVRFATAIYVLFIGVVRYIEDGGYKSILIILSSALFHFGLMPGITIFLLYLLLKRCPIVIYILAILSFIFTFLDISRYIADIAGFLGGGIKNKAQIYSTENTWYVEYLAENSKQAAWFIKYKFDAAFYGITAFFVLIGIYWRKITINEKVFQLFLFVLLLLTFRNLIADVPDLGVRYTNALIAFSVFFTYKIYRCNTQNNVLIKYMPLVVLVGCSLCAIYAFRCIFYYIIQVSQVKLS